MKKLKKITIVVPVYDEESNIEYFHSLTLCFDKFLISIFF